MTLEGWALVSNAAFFVLSALALVAAITVFLIARASDRAKDRQVAVFQADAASRIGEANKEAATARKEAADANLKSSELRLQIEYLQKLMQPRRLDESALRLLSISPKGKAEIFYQPDNGEAFQFAHDIRVKLLVSGWEVSIFSPITSAVKSDISDIQAFSDLPSAMRAGGSPTGITILRHGKNDGQTGILNPDDKGPAPTAFAALNTVVLRSLGSSTAGAEEAVPQDVIRIIISQKS